MRVAGCSCGELVKSGFRMDRVVLPVTVAIHCEKVFRQVRLHPFAELAAFMSKRQIGVVVPLVGAVGADNWSRTDENLPVGIACHKRTLEPFLLSNTPNRLFRAVGHIIW